jgi:tetratricopeptide (TPR) repeat protein
MKILLLFLTLTLTAALAVRADDAGALDAANRAYTEGHYDEAARQFQELIQASGYSAALCFDLANAEAKAGRIGPAILNYERARYLAPSDRDIDHNLQLARQQAGLQPDSLRWWQIALRALTIDQWLVIVDLWLGLIALAVIASVFVSRLAPGPNRAVAGKVVKTTLFVAIPCFLFTAYIALLAAPLRIEGVVMSKDAPLRLSPFDAAEQIGTLPEGELVTVEQKHDDYFRVEARDGKYGWMTGKSLEPVIAGSFDGSDTR